MRADVKIAAGCSEVAGWQSARYKVHATSGLAQYAFGLFQAIDAYDSKVLHRTGYNAKCAPGPANLRLNLSKVPDDRLSLIAPPLTRVKRG